MSHTSYLAMRLFNADLMACLPHFVQLHQMHKNAVILVFRRSCLTERDPLFTLLFSLREETAAQDRLKMFLCALSQMLV